MSFPVRGTFGPGSSGVLVVTASRYSRSATSAQGRAASLWLSHASRGHHRRRTHTRRQAQWQVLVLASCRSGRRSAQSTRRPQRHGSGDHRRRDHGLPQPSRRSVIERRTQRRPCRGLSGIGARRHHRSPMRVVPTGASFRRAGGDGRRLRRGHRRRRGMHDPGPARIIDRLGRGLSLRPGCIGALWTRRRSREPGHRRRDGGR